MASDTVNQKLNKGISLDRRLVTKLMVEVQVIRYSHSGNTSARKSYVVKFYGITTVECNPKTFESQSWQSNTASFHQSRSVNIIRLNTKKALKSVTKFC